MPRKWFALLAVLALAAPSGARADHMRQCGMPVSLSQIGSQLSLQNGCIERMWRTVPGLSTIGYTDWRTHHGIVSELPDFHLVLSGVRLSSSALTVTDTQIEANDDYAKVTWTLEMTRAIVVHRSVEMWRGIAGLRSQTKLTALTPLTLQGYTLDEVTVGSATATVHSFHAGADWREPGWEPQLAVGDPQTGDWREEHSAPEGASMTATGEWASAALETGGRISIVVERQNYASSIGSYDGLVLSAGVDFSRDVVYIGPFEESGHIQNPEQGPARARVLEPGHPIELEPVFTAFGTDVDDEAWQFSKYLTQHRLTPYQRALVFNSDGVDGNVISTGAKDDMNYDRFMQILPSVREMGLDTFVFDDGWMARSGDWCPDSLACPEPRWDGDPTSKFRARFPDDHFEAVQTALKGDPADPSDDLALGLWMTPMAYHPQSKAFQTNPQWSCAPVGTGTAAVSFVDDSSSYEPGIGLWNPRALGVNPDDGVTPMRLIDYMEGRIRRAIETYGATYFKFDFLVWVDCGGATPVTMYEYHDEFVDMVDRVQASHPEVTFQIDDTNDYRMFPFETVARGPSWFLNGGPDIKKTLHTAWNLAPFVPGSALGLRSLSKRTNIDAEMAAAITSHVTFSFPVDTVLTTSQRAQVKRWSDFYKAHRDTLGGFAFPLLADPDAGGWTALQPWDQDARKGWVLAYRQGASSPSVSIPLRGFAGVPDATSFTVTRIDPATGSSTSSAATAAVLRAGLTVDAAAAGYAIVRITPA